MWDEEIEIMSKNASKISKYLQKTPNFIDIGPGTSTAIKKKSFPIMEQMENLSSYTAIDICPEYALNALKIVNLNFPDVLCSGIIASLT